VKKMANIDFILKKAPLHISIPIALHIIILSGILYISRWEACISFAKKVNDTLPILTIAVTAISFYLILLLFYILLCLKIRKNLRPKFGVLWDRNKEPYCPIHEKPLSRHKVGMNDKIVAGLNCPECKQSFQIITDSGERLTLEEAKNKFN
jgi:hypothetical protein